MGAEEPLDGPSIREYERLVAHKPQSDIETLHSVWLLNSYAKYTCFVQRDFDQTHRLIDEAMRAADALSKCSFSKFDREAKCFAVFLVLNVARVSVYSGDAILGRKRFDELAAFIDTPETGVLQNFSPTIRFHMEKNLAMIGSSLSGENKTYFHEKIRKGTSRLTP